MYTDLALYINGEWIKNTEKGEKVINPADESELGWLPHASIAQLDEALESAKRGLELWKNTDPSIRGKILIKSSNLLKEKKDKIAKIMTLEQGKTLVEANGEIDRAIDSLLFNGLKAKELNDYLIKDPMWAPFRDQGVKTFIKPQPVGVSLGLTAWNFPSLLVARKIAPALAAGCSMIIKPSEETPGCGVELVKIFEEAGLPKGVLNLVFGIPSEISDYLFKKQEIRKVSFTGSIEVGKMLAKKAADTLKRCTFELGGHSPAIIAEDANIQKTIDAVGSFKFKNAGQICISPSRFFVHEKIYDEVVDGFVKLANNLKLGNGLNEDTTMGPMANSRRIDAMENFINDAQKKGANIITGGRRHGNVGFFWEPTVIDEIAEDADLLHTEIFGPIIPVIKYTDYDEAISKANSLSYGLCSYAYTEDKILKEKFAKDIEAGGISINTAVGMHVDIPYGGFKESGIGYEGGQEAIDSYLQKKNVNII